MGHYPFMISLDKCKRSCDTFGHLQKYVFRVKQKTNVQVFNTTTKNDSKTLIKHISSDYKCKLNSTIYNSNQKWNNSSVKSLIRRKSIIVGALAHVFVRIVSWYYVLKKYCW